MGLEYLASRIRTANAPPRATWWSRHATSTAKFHLFYGRTTEANIEEIRKNVDDQAQEWDLFIPKGCAAGHMEKHGRLELALIEAAREGLHETVERLGDLMISLADEQARDLAGNVPDLPARQLRYLLMAHTGLFISKVRHALSGQDLRKCREQMEANELALAAFTMEWF